MPLKYIPYSVDPLRGQAVLPFLRYKNQFTSKDFIVKGLPYFETELVEKVNRGGENLVIHGDCLNACAYLKEQGIKVDLVYIDPPFASGANYAKKIFIRKNPKLVEKLEAKEAELKQKAAEGKEVDNTELQAIEETMYGDIWQKEDYLNWMYERLLAIKEVMSETASIYVHLDWHIGHYVKILLDEVFGEENFRNEIVWGYRIQGVNKKTFARKHDTIFFYSKNTGYFFTPEKETIKYNSPFIDTKIEQANLSKLKEKELEEILDCINNKRSLPDKYKDKLFNRYYSEVYVRDVWDSDYTKPIISGSSEYLGYITQKPEGLLTRIITASTKDDMIVADFFGGSGVTATVAQKLKRKFITTDVGINSIQTIRDRLVELNASFNILKIKDGIDIFRNPQQTMDKLANLIPGLTTQHEFGKFWFGAMVQDGKICPCWVPDLKNKSTAILNASLFTKILDEATKLEDVTKIIICSIDNIDNDEIEKMIKDYDIRTQDGKPVEFIFKDLKELTDLLSYPDLIEFSVKEENNKYEIIIEKFISENLIRKMNEFNEKRKGKNEPIMISEEGLELIEYISIDTTSTGKVWTSDYEIKIDKRGYVIENGNKTKNFWNGKIVVDNKPIRMKVRNIAGDESIIEITA